MEAMKKNYKLFLAIMLGIAIGSILTHPADKKLLHSHNERSIADIGTMIGNPDSTINSNNRKNTASIKSDSSGNKTLLRHSNSAAKQSLAKEHENFRPVITSPSNTKRTTKKNVRLAGALD